MKTVYVWDIPEAWRLLKLQLYINECTGKAFSLDQTENAHVNINSGCQDVGVSTAIFILPLHGFAIVLLNGMLCRLFIFDFGIAQMLQVGNEIVYFARQLDDIIFSTIKLIRLFTYKSIPPTPPTTGCSLCPMVMHSSQDCKIFHSLAVHNLLLYSIQQLPDTS